VIQLQADQPAAPLVGWTAPLVQLWRWLRSQRWGLLTSLSVHATVAIVLASVIYYRPAEKPAEVWGIFGAPGDELDTSVPLDSVLESSAASLDETDPFSADVAEMLGPMATDQLMAALEGAGAGGGADGDGEGLKSLSGNISIPASAVRKGSFTVWTDPEDPLPRQRYRIIIQVTLPQSIKVYRLRDLTGEVRGTDGFHRVIKYKATDRKAVKDGIVQIEVAIPGASRLVKDTIRVRSEVLDETQTIDLVF
jgi:hypothetical protein